MDAATGHARERVKDRRRRDTGLIVGIAVGAVALGLSVFAALAWRAVTIQRAGESEALQQFEAVRSRLPTTDPLVQRDRSGRLVKRNRSSRGEAPPRQLSVIAYYSSGERLVTAEVPLWFLRVKGPAVQFALRGTGSTWSRSASLPMISCVLARAWCSTKCAITATAYWRGRNDVGSPLEITEIATVR
jgi:hypothetical protein